MHVSQLSEQRQEKRCVAPSGVWGPLPDLSGAHTTPPTLATSWRLLGRVWDPEGGPRSAPILGSGPGPPAPPP